MKKIILVIIIIAILPLAAFAQVGDARTRGMANAFTAVADDYNALYFNPAGLAYLNNGNFVLGIGGNVTMTKALPFGEADYPDPWYDDYHQQYSYWDDFTNSDVYFDPADYGFFWGEDEGDVTYDEAVEAYQEWRTLYSIYEVTKNLSDMNLYPRLAYAAKYWGISAINTISLEPRPLDEYRAEDSEFVFDLYKDSGVLGGVGINIGPVAVGATVKYFKRTSDVASFTAADAEEGPPEEFFTQVFFGSEDGSTTIEEDYRIEAGIGAIFTLGAASVGAYLDNLLFFLDRDDEGNLSVDAGLLNTLSVGAAWTPFNVKTEDKRGILNLIAAADLKNIGSSLNRELAAGVELGLNLGNIITADTRFGYSQALPGDMADMFGGVDPRLGTYSVGMGWKFLFGAINASFQMPADMVLDPPSGFLTEEELASTFGTAVVDIHFTF